MITSFRLKAAVTPILEASAIPRKTGFRAISAQGHEAPETWISQTISLGAQIAPALIEIRQPQQTL
jgi:hypothetical protein